jgi:hypothetical protein
VRGPVDPDPSAGKSTGDHQGQTGCCGQHPRSPGSRRTSGARKKGAIHRVRNSLFVCGLRTPALLEVIVQAIEKRASRARLQMLFQQRRFFAA